jgi:hypothetical protein
MNNTLVRSTDTRTAFVTRMADAMSVPDGTFCFNPRTATEETDGYTVAVFPDAEQWMTGRITREDITAYVFAHATEAMSAGVHVCGWRDGSTGVVYLYLARVVQDRAYAATLARRGGNVVYTTLATGRPVRL